MQINVTQISSKNNQQLAQQSLHYSSMSSEWRFPSIPDPSRTRSQYKLVPTLLDEGSQQSALNKSSFKGFFNLAAIFTIIIIFTQPVVNWVQCGYFLQPYLYHVFKKDFFLCILVWPLFFLWSFTSFLLQKMIIYGFPVTISTIFQHLTQAGLFIFASYLILTKNWCSSHAAFVIIQACAHFMKMHSYTTVNRDYREHKQLAGKQLSEIMSQYPKNINVRDFVLFMWTPWLVYDVYPRKKYISVYYIVKKIFITLTCVLMAYLLHTSYLMPVIQAGFKYNHLELMFRCMLPSTLILLLIFYLVFEGITNFFAEITKLNHREFYEDWWNSTTYEEFNRKWNKPVHIFLYRHVYLELILRWRIKKSTAQTITFLFSAMLHEFLLAMIFRTIRPFFLAFILGQVPLIYLTKFMRGKKSGNYVFWLGLIIGPSIIVSCYLKIDDNVAALFLRQTPHFNPILNN